MLRAALILTAAAFLISPANVNANTPKPPPATAPGALGALPDPVINGQHAPPAWLGPLAERWKQFWAGTEDRSLRPVAALDIAAICPQGIVLWQAPTLGGPLGLGWHHMRPDGTMSCTAWLSDATISRLKPPARKLANPDWQDARDDAIDGCELGTHELGHALDLQHTPTGVMAAGETRQPAPHAWAPTFCRTWATAMLRPYRESQRRPSRYTWAR